MKRHNNPEAIINLLWNFACLQKMNFCILPILYSIKYISIEELCYTVKFFLKVWKFWIFYIKYSFSRYLPVSIMKSMYNDNIGKLNIFFNALLWTFSISFISSLSIFLHASSPYSNTRIIQVLYNLSLILFSSFPTWCFFHIALISLLIASHFLLNLVYDLSSSLIC